MDKDKIGVQQILGCCHKVEGYCAGVSYSEFLDTPMLQDACIKNIEEMGERASKISQEFQQSHPNIRWRAMIGARNHLVHDYEGVDFLVLWEIIQKDIPELIVQLEKLC